jgi:hypothetical protein
MDLRHAGLRCELARTLDVARRNGGHDDLVRLANAGDEQACDVGGTEDADPQYGEWLCRHRNVFRTASH